ncbi:MAG: methylated-DNA--[protein]-cysteine S-methyltransferase [Bacteroidota bacterium]
MINYKRVAKAIKYISDHSTDQPKLEDIAKSVHLSPYHFHRMFKEWAGVTPKEFLQFISLNHAKKLLKDNQTIEDTTFHTGLSSTSRLHDLFINIEGMTPGEFKNEGKELEIKYDFTESPFGQMMVASTGKGICSLQFVKTRQSGINLLERTWAKADIKNEKDDHIENVEHIFNNDWENLDKIKLHIKGTDFQLKVWEALLKIPSGTIVTYSDVAKKIKNPKATRAVGTALAKNTIAYLIPCHRVIKKVGGIGEYRWGRTRKKAIIGWESAKLSIEQNGETD